MGETDKGGAVSTDVGYAGTSGTREPDSPRSYSNLGQSPIAMGGRPAPTPAPEVQTSSVDMPLLNDQDMSRNFFVNRASRSLMDLVGGSTPSATQTDDRGPSGADLGAVSVDDNQFNKGLASLTGARAFSPMSDFPSYMTSPRAGTDTRDENLDATDPTMAALRRAAPALIASNQRDVDQGMLMQTRPDLFPQELGGGTIDSSLPLSTLYTRGFTPGEDVGMLYGRGFTPSVDDRQRPDADEMTRYVSPTGFDTRDEALDATVGADFFGEGTLGPLGSEGTAKLYEEIKKGRKPKDEKERTFFQKVVDYFTKVLRGDPNYKGPSAAQINPFTQVPGPGPYVGGGVPSPSAEMGGGAPSPIQCPPGFKFDPVQNICVPIVAPAPPVTTPPAPGTTAPAPATGGISAIPNVYPFTLTPPIGAPIGNIAPVRS